MSTPIDLWCLRVSLYASVVERFYGNRGLLPGQPLVGNFTTTAMSGVLDIMEVSGRAMLEALTDGQHDPAPLAELAKRRLRVHSTSHRVPTGVCGSTSIGLCGIVAD